MPWLPLPRSARKTTLTPRPLPSFCSLRRNSAPVTGEASDKNVRKSKRQRAAELAPWQRSVAEAIRRLKCLLHFPESAPDQSHIEIRGVCVQDRAARNAASSSTTREGMRGAIEEARESDMMLEILGAILFGGPVRSHLVRMLPQRLTGPPSGLGTLFPESPCPVALL